MNQRFAAGIDQYEADNHVGENKRQMPHHRQARPEHDHTEDDDEHVARIFDKANQLAKNKSEHGTDDNTQNNLQRGRFEHLEEAFGDVPRRFGHQQAFCNGGRKSKDNDSEAVIEPDNRVERLRETSLRLILLNDRNGSGGRTGGRHRTKDQRHRQVTCHGIDQSGHDEKGRERFREDNPNDSVTEAFERFHAEFRANTKGHKPERHLRDKRETVLNGLGKHFHSEVLKRRAEKRANEHVADQRWQRGFFDQLAGIETDDQHRTDEGEKHGQSGRSFRRVFNCRYRHRIFFLSKFSSSNALS